MRLSYLTIKSLVLATILLSTTVAMAYAVDQGIINLPRISKVCESKSGDLKAIDDGFSSFKKCPTNSRTAYIVGETGPQGPVGPKGDQGPKGDAGQFKIDQVYTKIDGPFNTSRGIASTIAHGCNPGDLAIGGGLFSYTGRLSDWQTVRSTPRVTEPSDIATTMNGWDTTVLNNLADGNVYVMARCIDLP